jgi:hypothetical protein
VRSAVWVDSRDPRAEHMTGRSPIAINLRGIDSRASATASPERFSIPICFG